MEITFRRDQAPAHGPVSGNVGQPTYGSRSTATVEAVVARVHGIGDPLVYDGGKRLEYRDGAGLRELARQLVGKKIVVNHPTRGTGRLRESPDKTVVGQVTGTRIEGGLAIAELKIFHPDGIRALRHGIRELSAGYGAGTDANGWQRVFEADHLALVREGRCGAACRVLRVDGDCGCGGPKPGCSCN